MVEQSLPIAKVLGSNPDIGKKIEHFTVNCIEKTKIKEKRPGIAHFFKKVFGLKFKHFYGGKNSRKANQ